MEVVVQLLPKNARFPWVKKELDDNVLSDAHR